MTDDILMSLADKANKVIPVEDGDYYNPDDNGLLYCGKCHTRKQCMLNFPSGPRKIMCMCKCEQEKQERKNAERKALEFADNIKRNQSNCYAKEIRDRMLEKNFANADNSKLIQIAKNYVNNFPKFLKEGKGLLICGGTGSGKSYMSTCICNALLEKGYPCYFTSFGRLRNKIAGMYEGKQEFIDSLNKYSLLVLDDLGAESNTDYMFEIIHNIIDCRVNAGLPTIVTTNLTKQELFSREEMKKQRIYSRLYEMCILVDGAGEDRRKKEMIDSQKKFKEILGI